MRYVKIVVCVLSLGLSELHPESPLTTPPPTSAAMNGFTSGFTKLSVICAAFFQSILIFIFVFLSHLFGSSKNLVEQHAFK